MNIRDLTWLVGSTIFGDLTRASKLSQEIEQELLFHIAERKDRLVASGMAEAEAELEARRLFGDFFSAREQCLKSYNLGLTLACKRIGMAVCLVIATTVGTLVITEKFRPVTSIDDRLNALFTDLASESESRQRDAVVDALVLAGASDLSSLRQEIYTRVSDVPIPEVIYHLQRVALDDHLTTDLRLSAIQSLGKIAVDNESIQTFLAGSAVAEEDPRICAAMLAQVSPFLDLPTIQSLVCSPDVSRAAKVWGLFEIRSRCGKDFDSSMAWLADAKVLETAKSLLLSTTQNDEQVAIVKLFRESKSEPVRDWLLDLLNEPIENGCLVHVLFDLGQYVDDDMVASRLNDFAIGAGIDVQNHVKRSLALRNR